MPTITSMVSSGWGLATPTSSDASSAWDKLATKDKASDHPLLDAEPTEAKVTLGYSDAPPAEDRLSSLFGTATKADASSVDSYHDLTPYDEGRALSWALTQLPVDLGITFSYISDPAIKDAEVTPEFSRTMEFESKLDAEALTRESLYNPGLLAFVYKGSVLYQPGTAGSVFFDYRYVPPKPRVTTTDSRGTGLRWQDAATAHVKAAIPWGAATRTDGVLTGIRYPSYTGPVVIPEPDIPEDPAILEAYMIGNLVTVIDVTTGEPIMASNLSLTLDEASFSWALTMDVLNRSSMDLIRPTSSTPKQVVIDINGHVWTFLVEKYRRNFKFPTEAYSVTGSSRMQLLAEPYAQPISGVNTSDISANQIIDAMLLNTGFTCVWEKGGDGNVPDWVVPAGAFTYVNQTPMQLVARVASVIGALARPYASGDIIEIVPRYLLPYWQWSPLTAHKIIPSAIMTSLGGDWVPSPDWNSCYVSGVNHGVGVLVTRAGTSGHKAAPDVLDDLLTDSTANTYRGRVELSKGGSKELVSIQIPLFQKDKADTPGLVLPGMLCDVRESEDWIGLCLGTAIQASGVGASLVTQTLKLERHTSEIT